MPMRIHTPQPGIAPEWHLVEQHLISPVCDTCGQAYTGEWEPPYYDTVAQATTDLTQDGWAITPDRFQCRSCVEDDVPPVPTPTIEVQRWKPLHGWSVVCQDCGTSVVEGLDPEEEVISPVWSTPGEARRDLSLHTEWTLTDRTRCPACTTTHTCQVTGHQWQLTQHRADVQVGLERCGHCADHRLVGLAS